MRRITKAGTRLAITAATAAGLVTTGMTAAQATVHQTSAGQVTILRAVITDKDLYLDGPTSFAAGRLHVSLENKLSKGKEAAVAVARLAPGYTWHAWRQDLKTAFTNLFGPHGSKKKGLKALNHAIDNITVYGGLEAVGKGEHGALLIDQGPGTYYVYDDSYNAPRHPHRLTIGAPAGPQTLPATTAKVVAQTNRRFSGSTVLPAHGDVMFKNVSTESPHLLVLLHVKDGTTRKQVINGLEGNGPPNFTLPGEQDFEVLTTGQQMEMHLNLPTGKYAELCFFPDPKTGMPHFAMGMVRMVHVK